MNDDEFEARVAGGGLPPLPEPLEPQAETVPQVARDVRHGAATAAPEPDSFRRSAAYLAGQIARAVARGQRVL
jgi:hypothetical protein